MIKQFLFVLALLFSVGSASLYAAPQVIPQAQAAHFCQLLIADGPSVSTLSTHAAKAIQPADSLTVEQIFAGYVLAGKPCASSLIRRAARCRGTAPPMRCPPL